jgi:hypothetical protein
MAEELVSNEKSTAHEEPYALSLLHRPTTSPVFVSLPMLLRLLDAQTEGRYSDAR